MKHNMIKVSALILGLAILFCSCGTAGGEDETFYYDFTENITSLDPQFATQDEAHTILINCMEGLVRKTAQGDIVPALAEEIILSEGDTVYTFKLREDAMWSDGTAVTSHDFATSIYRLFGAELFSPYVDSFLSIDGAAEVYSGEASAGYLGISTPDDKTLIIRLEQPDAFFLSAMSMPAALPCKKSFFDETRGRYGLDQNSLLSNGPFVLTSWNEQRIVLSKNPDYYGEVLPAAAVFFIEQENHLQRLLDGDTDAGVVPTEMVEQVADKGLNYQTFDNSICAIAFNQSTTFFAQSDIRRALQMTLDREQLWEVMAEQTGPAVGIIPPTTQLPNGELYHQLAGDSLNPVYSPEAGHALYQDAFTRFTSSPDLSNLTLLIVEDDTHQMLMASVIQRMWQENLSLFINIEMLPQQEYDKRIKSLNYTIALVNIVPTVNDPSGILGQFVSASALNVTGYQNTTYDELIWELSLSRSVEDMIELSERAEDILIGDAVVIPISLNTTYFATQDSVRGVEYSPYSGRVNFTMGTK